MKLLNHIDRAQLLRNGRVRRQVAEQGLEGTAGCFDLDFLPVVKLSTPDAQATWLLTEIDPDDHDRAFGLCDLGLGTPELGYVSLAELAALRGPLGMRVRRDPDFIPQKTLSGYLAEALRHGFITA